MDKELDKLIDALKQADFDTDEKQNMVTLRNLAAPFLKEPLTFEEALMLTGLRKSSLYQLMYKNQIPYYKPFGKKVYFKRSELETFLFKNRRATNKEISEAADTLLNENSRKTK